MMSPGLPLVNSLSIGSKVEISRQVQAHLPDLSYAEARLLDGFDLELLDDRSRSCRAV